MRCVLLFVIVMSLLNVAQTLQLFVKISYYDKETLPLMNSTPHVCGLEQLNTLGPQLSSSTCQFYYDHKNNI